MSRFRDVLAHRGRIILFTKTASVGVVFEQMAERNHAQVICTRGWADPTGPIQAWHRILAARDYGVLSCDQRTYLSGAWRLGGTDYVWVGDCFDTPDVHARYLRACAKAREQGVDVRFWTLSEDAV